MRRSFRLSLVTALGFVLAASLAAPFPLILSNTSALAQAAPAQATPAQGAPDEADDPTQQIALTPAQIDAFIAVQKPMGEVIGKLPAADQDNPNPGVLAKLDAIAKAHKFADYDDYQTVSDNIALVMAGIDPESKKYMGADVLLKQQINALEADKSMSAEDKKEQLAQLNAALKSVEPVKISANIPLVEKYYDQLMAAVPQDQQ